MRTFVKYFAIIAAAAAVILILSTLVTGCGKTIGDDIAGRAEVVATEAKKELAAAEKMPDSLEKVKAIEDALQKLKTAQESKQLAEAANAPIEDTAVGAFLRAVVPFLPAKYREVIVGGVVFLAALWRMFMLKRAAVSIASSLERAKEVNPVLAGEMKKSRDTIAETQTDLASRIVDGVQRKSVIGTVMTKMPL